MRLLVSLCFAICTASASFAQDTKRNVMAVFHMSGSMWGQMDGTAKVEIARDAFNGLLTD